MCDRNLTQVLRLTVEMENRAADGDWGVVEELDVARLAELEKLNIDAENDGENQPEILDRLLQSTRTIVNLVRDAKSNLRQERQQLLRGKLATGSYQRIQENV